MHPSCWEVTKRPENTGVTIVRNIQSNTKRMAQKTKIGRKKNVYARSVLQIFGLDFDW